MLTVGVCSEESGFERRIIFMSLSEPRLWAAVMSIQVIREISVTKQVSHSANNERRIHIG